MNRVYTFLLLFAVVLFLEAIGGSYMVSAIQSIERQFQIPSKLSGFMVSASDFGYIPTVIFISYFGSKGNRAKWIGIGTVITGLSYILIASPNFLFPVEQPHLNLTSIQSRLAPKSDLLLSNASIKDFLSFAPIYDRIPKVTRLQLLSYFGEERDVQRVERRHSLLKVHNATEREYRDNPYSIDGAILSKAIDRINLLLRGEGDEEELKEAFLLFVQNRLNQSDVDVSNLRRSALAPFSFCGKLINELRKVMKDMKCDRKVSNFGPFVIMFTALVALGIGRTMPWSLGVPMIDDNVKRKSLPAYFAGISFIRILGPITGFLIGSFSNKLYYTLQPPPGLTAKDPTWIGAWWLGFLIVGVLIIVPSGLLYFFPTKSRKRMKVSPEELKMEKNSGLAQRKEKRELSFFDRHVEDEKHLSPQEKFLAFRNSYKELMKSKVYIGAVAGRVIDSLAFRGYMVFLPKYLENHYGIPQYKAHQLMAMFGVFGFAMGTACGGFITRHFKLNGRRAAIFVFVASTLNLLIFLLKGFLGCHSVVNSVGVNGLATNFNYTNSCNAECECESAPLFPVCDTKGYAYFSPCHAGCRDVTVLDPKTYSLEFSSCDCSVGEVLKKENCHDDCKIMIWVFFCSVTIGAFVAGTGLVPGMLILLRSVPPAQRSISLGFQGFLVSLLATLPSPFLWGIIFDSACLVWNNTCSGVSGACAIYDPSALRMRAHFIYSGIRGIAALTDIYVIIHAKGLNILDEEDEEDVMKKENLAMQAISVPQ